MRRKRTNFCSQDSPLILKFTIPCPLFDDPVNELTAVLKDHMHWFVFVGHSITSHSISLFLNSGIRLAQARA